jgi:hypothetical protein
MPMLNASHLPVFADMRERRLPRADRDLSRRTAMGARPVAQSAAGVVWAAALADDGPRDGCIRDRNPPDR